MRLTCLWSQACGLNEDCADMEWAYSLLVIISMGIALYIVFTSSHEEDNSGLRSVALFFYQVVGLVKSR